VQHFFRQKFKEIFILVLCTEISNAFYIARKIPKSEDARIELRAAALFS